MKGKITEVFDSVQGEGLYLGDKQVFVRFFGCNLTCSFCDTRTDRFLEYEPQELVNEINLYNRKLYNCISFTGGEPLMQSDFLKEVAKDTHRQRYINYLETNGTLTRELEDVLEYIDIVAMDIKLPSSTGRAGLWEAHHKFLEIASQKEAFAKVIICSSTKKEDLWEALDLIKGVDRSMVLVLQPNSYEDRALLIPKLSDFRDVCFREGVVACIIPQMHKIIGVQ